MADRFRELESPPAGRLKDIVLMATVTGFESLRHPRRSDLKQFAELFEPLFAASSDEARRQAAAALSQCPHVPQSVALLIGAAPLSIAAIFLTRSTSITDATLLQILRSQDAGHATAIARRDNLSVSLVDALVERRQTTAVKATSPAPRQPDGDGDGEEAARRQREDKLRNEIRTLARTRVAPALPVVEIEPVSSLHQALLVRFARSGEANLFAASLAAALSSSLTLSERILLDVSGQHLAITLTALSMPVDDTLFVLTHLYPDLGERLGGATRGQAVLAGIDREGSRRRVASWLSAEQEDHDAASHQPYLGPDRAADPRRAASPEKSAVRGTAGSQQQVFARRR